MAGEHLFAVLGQQALRQFRPHARCSRQHRADGAAAALPARSEVLCVLRHQTRHRHLGRHIGDLAGVLPCGRGREGQRAEAVRLLALDGRAQPRLAPRHLGVEMRRDADFDAVQRRCGLVVEADEMEAGGRTRLMATLAGAIIQPLDQRFRRAHQLQRGIVEPRKFRGLEQRRERVIGLPYAAKSRPR